jgi:hypothetical protein
MGQGQSASSATTLPDGHPPVLSAAGQPPAQCPMHGGKEVVNPANNMPHLSQSPAPNQAAELPTERTESSIPRAPSPVGSPAPARWEYPSPQQFYNALARKGWETPEENVVTMVEIHNFLNEMAWKEVLRWETMSNPYVSPLERRIWKSADTDSFYAVTLALPRNLNSLGSKAVPGNYHQRPDFTCSQAAFSPLASTQSRLSIAMIGWLDGILARKSATSLITTLRLLNQTDRRSFRSMFGPLLIAWVV